MDRLTFDTDPGPLEVVLDAASPSGRGRRRIIGQAVPWNVIRRTSGGVRAMFRPGSVSLLGQPVVRDHDPTRPFGVVAEQDATDAGLKVAVAASVTRDGDEALTLAGDGVLRHFSVGVIPTDFTVETDDQGQYLDVRSTDPVELSLLIRGAFGDLAAVDQVAATAPTTTDPDHPQETPDMPADIPIPVAAHDELDARIAAAAETTVRALIPADLRTPEPHPLTQFGSYSDYVMAVYHGDADQGWLRAALDDHVTGDNAGLIPPAWVGLMYGLIALGRPVITAFGTMPLPPKGMTITYPHESTTAADSDLVAVRTNQLEEPASDVIKFGSASATVATYSGAGDISIELLERSDPSFRELYLRRLAIAYAHVTDNAVTDGLFGTVGLGATPVWDGGGDPDLLLAAVWDGAVDCETATGQPAEFVLAATDIFKVIGALVDADKRALFVNPNLGPTNALGNQDLTRNALSIGGLPVVHARNAANGKIAVTNRECVKIWEDGPKNMEAVDVAKLGSNIAIYGYLTYAVVNKTGVQVIPAA